MRKKLKLNLNDLEVKSFKTNELKGGKMLAGTHRACTEQNHCTRECSRSDCYEK